MKKEAIENMIKDLFENFEVDIPSEIWISIQDELH
jgi:hypothetical protein